jgi:hypothetical protein
MELIILTKQQYDEIINRLDALNEKLRKQQEPLNMRYISNEEFLKLLNISKRTAQTWRDEGKISFSQIGNKIYYLLFDIDDLLKHHRVKAFNPSFRTRGIS